MKKITPHLFIFLLVSFAGINALHAQKECNTVLKGEAIARYKNYVKASQKFAQQRTQVSKYHVRVFIHDFISDDGTDSAWSYNEIITEFNMASNFFGQYNMCLVLAGIDYPRNTAYKDSFNKANIGVLVAMGHADALDLSLHKKLADSDGSGLNGTAYNIPSKYFSLSRGAIGSRSFAHEAGHCLGLAHVFETVHCLECPDGSNGADCGDMIADTRATPDADSAMAANTSAACVYSGNLAMNCDGNTQMYNPEVINMMCYGRRSCRSVFTVQQVTVMNFVLQSVPGMTGIWFDTPGFVVIETTIGALIINTDQHFAGNPLQVGNNAPGFNVLVGGNNTQQRFISPTQVRITPGVKLLQPADTRGRIQIKVANYCQE